MGKHDLCSEPIHEFDYWIPSLAFKFYALITKSCILWLYKSLKYCEERCNGFNPHWMCPDEKNVDFYCIHEDRLASSKWFNSCAPPKYEDFFFNTIFYLMSHIVIILCTYLCTHFILDLLNNYLYLSLRYIWIDITAT